MEDEYPKLDKRSLPKAASFGSAIGVGFVVLGLAVGTGELILWPHLTAKFGLGILWGALIGIFLQYFINQEVARNVLATGESFFTSSARVFKWLVPFWIFSAIILYLWPGWAGAIGTTLSALFGFGSYQFWGWVSLALVLLLTFSGNKAYKIFELSFKLIVPVFFVFLIFVSFLNLNWSHLQEAFFGIINFGWLPQGIDLKVFLGAVVFSGAGGLLNLCISLWYRDKQLGMGKYAGQITNPVTGKPTAVSTTGNFFEETKENLSKWKSWMNYAKLDQGIIFGLMGFVSLVLLSLNSYAILSPQNIIPEGPDIAVVQAEIFGAQWGSFGYDLFLVMAFLMLFATMWAIIDAFTRIVTDVVHVNSRVGPFKKYLEWAKGISIHHLYYGLITLIVILNAIMIPFATPLVFLVLSSVLGGMVMVVYIPILLYMNNKKLPKTIRPGIFTNFVLIFATLFYAFFSIIIIFQYL